ncbi:MAG: FAD-binding oxidoreductase [Proteobacteria bacterium]|nr:FAD-binding oxidoreductase [Pseudomonadota bacterium]
MRRRTLLRAGGAAALLGARPAGAAAPLRRVRPGDPGWPDDAAWHGLSNAVGGRLMALRTPLIACVGGPDGASSPACLALFKELKNPYFINANPALTQTSGWMDAWTSKPSAYAVLARSTADVAAAVDFARTRNLRLVVKGGGHAYQGTSNAEDSLLIWTQPMSAISLHDAFVPDGCSVPPVPAVTVEAGAIWMRVYDAVTTGAGRYVQGGGCATVGVAGLIQSGGFGSFSKRYGLAAAGLLQAEIVTADGRARVVNACTDPELFWALKGGGGGSLGVVTRLTLRTHDLPDWFGGAFLTVRASDEAAFRDLTARFVAFYAERLFNPNWGESVTFRPDNSLAVTMVFQGLDQSAARAAWQPFLDWIAAAPSRFTLAEPPRIQAVRARDFWNPAYLLKNVPEAVLRDDRPGAPAGNVFWAGNLGETGWFLHGYDSAWLPASLLDPGAQGRLADALFAASRRWRVALHFNKGLAGAPQEAVAAARDTAINPAALGAFALAISAAAGPPAFVGLPGHTPDLGVARAQAKSVRAAMEPLRALLPAPATYLSESDYFAADWQQGFWGANHPRLRAAKQRYDPDGLFFVHHGVGSEDWSRDGFERRG